MELVCVLKKTSVLAIIKCNENLDEVTDNKEFLIHNEFIILCFLRQKYCTIKI